MKKIATHVHTAPMSGCAQVSGEEVPALYRAQGFDAIVLTNHYSRYILEEYYGIAEEGEQVERFLENYEETRLAGERAGIPVWLGAELNPEPYNRPGSSYPVREFLLYGLTPDFVRAHPRMYRLKQEEIFDFCRKNGILMFQAHPFRLPTEPGDPRFMHGIEVFNGNPRHDSRNELAAAWARENKFLKAAGDDFHEYGDEGRACTLAPDDVTSYRDFVRVLREGRTQAAVLL